MDGGKSFSAPIIDDKVLKKVQARQSWYQERQAKIGFSYLLGKGDRLTSVIIPSVLLAAGMGLAGRALYNMYTGTGKGDQ